MLQIAICDNIGEDSREICSQVEEVLRRYTIRYNLQVYETGEELLMAPVLFDLIFLDAELNGEDAIGMGKKLHCRNRAAKIIYHYRSSQCCEDAVNRSHAFACLKKPIEKSILEEQIRDFLAAWGDAQETWISLGQIKGIPPENEKQLVRLPVKEILYFECQKNGKTIKAVTERGDYLYQGVLSDVEEKMEPFGFAVCSRGILINLNQISRLDGYEVIMTNRVKLPLSQRRSTAFKEKMKEFYYNPIEKKRRE